MHLWDIIYYPGNKSFTRVSFLCRWLLQAASLNPNYVRPGELLIVHVLRWLSLFQVETVGDKYMTVSGLPETCDNHAKCIARLALDLMDVAQNVMMGSAPVVSGLLCCGGDVLEVMSVFGVPN